MFSVQLGCSATVLVLLYRLPYSSSRLISFLLIVSADLRVILISRPGCVFPPHTPYTYSFYYLEVDANLQR